MQQTIEMLSGCGRRATPTPTRRSTAGMAPQGGPQQGGGYGAAVNGGGYGAAAPATSGVYGSGSVGATGVVRPYGQPPPAATSAYGGAQRTIAHLCLSYVLCHTLY